MPTYVCSERSPDERSDILVLPSRAWSTGRCTQATARRAPLGVPDTSHSRKSIRAGSPGFRFAHPGYLLRSARSGRYHPRRMELDARPDVLRHRDRPAQFARDHRRPHPVPAQEDLSGHRPFEQGARRAHPGKVGEGFAEGVLEQFHNECRRWRNDLGALPLPARTRACPSSALVSTD